MQILAGYRILDTSTHGVGPIAGSVLADWGAEVIKIEDPDNPDVMRAAAVWGIPAPEGGVSHMYNIFNRGKRSVAINLKSDEGREVLMRIAATCDVFLTTFPTPVRQRLRIDVEDVRARFPNMIYARNSGRGIHGESANLGGFDATSYWSRGGFAMATSQPGQELPTQMPAPAFGDSLTGFALASGIVAALLHRERTGHAMVVDTSLLNTGMWTMQTLVTATSLLGTADHRRPERGRTAPLVNTYRTSDGRFIHLCMDQQRYWPSFCDAVGKPEWKTDERIGTWEAREKNAAWCIEQIEQLMASRTYDEWNKLLPMQRGPFDPVQTVGELNHDPQAVANGYLAQVEDDLGRKYNIVQPPVQFDETPYQTRTGPHHGVHTDEVLAEIGIGEEELIDLKVAGAIM